ncbi:hypothetical protein SAMN05216553_12633 [Lentzea fradiae]|uniref:VWFA domain-containing protein n=1 Tax=Lentzea fradiae TaxID=200378 RepID=A0A1G8D585_9PSEU|nr:VWA domain-containing protein [Lentzea fradiae]SDH52937.1 hypothetical protein SAMN05216553_12633 [Lentzea fradiae]
MKTSSIRRSLIERSAVGRQVISVPRRRKAPAWLRRALRFLVSSLFLLLLTLALEESEKPSSLENSMLAGPRLTTGPVCLDEAVDVSGSMAAFTPQRMAAEQALFDFATRELGDDDLFSESFFAGSARTALPPTALSGLTSPPGVPDGIDYDNTLLAPAVDALVSARSDTPAEHQCSTRALVIITDGVVADAPDALAESLRRGGYTRVYAVVPVETGWGRPSGLTGGALDAIVVEHFSGDGVMGLAASIIADAKPLDVIFGEIAGSLTGQTLVQAK